MLEEALATALQGHWETHCNPSPRTQEEAQIRLPGRPLNSERLTCNITAVRVQGGHGYRQSEGGGCSQQTLVNERSEFL